MKRILPITIVCTCLLVQVIYGATGKISGYLYDLTTHEPIPDANVFIEGTSYGTVSKDGGFFVISGIPEGEYSLRVQVLGYQEETRAIRVEGNVLLRWALTPKAIELDPVIVTATLSDHRLSQVSMASQVYTSLRLQRQVGFSVGEAMATAAGVLIKSYDGLAGPALPAIRGANVDQVVVLMDGLRLNTAQGGGVDLNLLPLAAVGKIEILRGGHSVLLGSDAIGGAVHIHSKEPLNNKNFSYGIATSIGSFATYGWNLNLAQKMGDFSYFVDYHRLQTEGDFTYKTPTNHLEQVRQNNDYQAGNLFVKTNYQLGAHHSFHLLYHQLDAEKGNAGSVNVNPWSGALMLTPHARAHSTRRLSAMKSENQLSDRLRWETQLFYQTFDYHYVDPDGWMPVDDRHENSTLGVNMNVQVALHHRLQSTIGVEMRRERLQSTKFDADDRNVQSLYLQNEFRASLPWGKWPTTWMIIPALRWDRYSDIGAQFSPKLGWLLSTGQDSRLTLRGNIGSSYRVPTFDDLYWPDEGWGKGNPDLKPETAVTFDVGCSWQRQQRFSTRLECNYFHNTIENLISWNADDHFVWMPMNIGKARISGVETGFALHWPNDRLFLEIFHVFMNAVDATDGATTKGKKLPYRPQNKLDVQIGSTVHSFFTTLTYSLIDKRYTNADNSHRLAACGTLDGTIGCSLSLARFKWQTKVQLLNILNQSIYYYDGYPSPGRTVRLTLAVNY